MVEKYTCRNRNRDIFQLSANIPLLLKGTDLLDFFSWWKERMYF